MKIKLFTVILKNNYNLRIRFGYCSHINFRKIFLITHNTEYEIFIRFDSVLTVITPEKWEHILASNNLNIVELRDSRYNQIVHMVSAANGAEEFYTIEVNIIFSFNKYYRFNLYHN